MSIVERLSVSLRDKYAGKISNAEWLDEVWEIFNNGRTD